MSRGLRNAAATLSLCASLTPISLKPVLHSRVTVLVRSTIFIAFGDVSSNRPDSEMDPSALDLGLVAYNATLPAGAGRSLPDWIPALPAGDAAPT